MTDYENVFDVYLNDTARVVVEKVENGMTVHDALRTTGGVAGWGLYAMEPAPTYKWFAPTIDHRQSLISAFANGHSKITTADIAAASFIGNMEAQVMFRHRLVELGQPLFEASLSAC